MCRSTLIIHVDANGDIGQIWERQEWDDVIELAINKAKELLDMNDEDKIRELLEDGECIIKKHYNVFPYIKIAQANED